MRNRHSLPPAAPPQRLSRLRRAAAHLAAAHLAAAVGLAAWGAASAASPGAEAQQLQDWLGRMQAAARQHSYVGTFVMTTAGHPPVTGRIWRASEGDRLVEKVETLQGTPRTVVRNQNERVTLMPEQKLARFERRAGPSAFTDLLKAGDASIAEHYQVKPAGADRIAGLEADQVVLQPRDGLRYGYRIWSERRTGLLVKMQTMGPDGEVLEQAAFTELQIDAPLSLDKMAQGMVAPEGWRSERVEITRTTAQSEGWALKAVAPGFKSLGCWRRRAGAADGALQCVYSDGLASVSAFFEPYDRQRHGQEGLLSAGASRSQSRRVQDWWVTVVGEVPPATLRLFAEGLERRR